MVNARKDQQWESAPNLHGGFTFKLAEDGRRVDVDGQFAFSYAAQRRSLAMDMAEIVDFASSEKLRRKYISVLMKEPPMGFLAVGLEQIFNADRYFWVRLGELTRKGIKMKPDGRPCDKVFEKVFEDFTFNMMMMPRQGTLRAPQAPQGPPRKEPAPTATQPRQETGKKAQRRQDLARTAKDNAAADAISNAFKRPKTDNKGGKGGGGKAPSARLPAKLIGMCSVSSKETGSRKFCFAYGMDGCAAAVAGAACPKGLHACMKLLSNGGSMQREAPDL